MLKPTVIEAPVGTAKAFLYYGQNVLDTLRQLPDGSVQMVCTSPPYWGLRDYGVEPQSWPEITFTPMPGVEAVVIQAQDVALGLEDDPMSFVGHLVLILREARRVLRDDGTCWVNLGDSYATTGPGNTKLRDERPNPSGKFNLMGSAACEDRLKRKASTIAPGLKNKDLVGIPWRFAFAAQADGWFFRSDIIWAKGNAMPESVRDRPTKAHEYVFLLTKQEKYFYDQIAIKEPASPTSHGGRSEADRGSGNTARQQGIHHSGTSNSLGPSASSTGKNKRSVWNVNPKPYAGAHFAVWPPELVEPMILAGSSNTACPHCLAPWAPDTGRLCEACDEIVPTQANACPSCGHVRDWKQGRMAKAEMVAGDFEGASGRHTPRLPGNYQTSTVLVGQRPTCDCEHNDGSARSVVMDIFSGSGTTGMVALKLNRDYIGIDLNESYLPLAEARILGQSAPKQADAASAAGDDLFALLADSP